MTIKISKEIDPIRDEYRYWVIVNDRYITNRSFKPNEPPESIYNEEKNFKEIKEIADRIERLGTADKVLEIVYQKELPEQNVNPESANQ